MRKSQPLPGWVARELRANFTRASQAGRRAAKTEPRAARVEYRAREHALRIELTNGVGVTLPVPGILSSVFAGPEWLTELGRIGGRRSSAA